MNDFPNRLFYLQVIEKNRLQFGDPYRMLLMALYSVHSTEHNLASERLRVGPFVTANIQMFEDCLRHDYEYLHVALDLNPEHDFR